jgi:translation initiation factor IF-2
MRVHEIAKKYDKTSKEILEILNELGIEGKKSVSGLDEGQVAKVEAHFSTDKVEAEVETKDKKKKKKKATKLKEKKEKAPKEKKEKKKKGKRNEFTMNKVEEVENEVIEEDGVKLIKIRGEITLGNFAEKLGLNASELIKKLFLKGQMLTINSTIDMELAEELAEDYDAMVEQEEVEEMAFGDKFNLLLAFTWLFILST